MTDASRTLQPAPMEGGGSYNRNSHVQASGLLPAVVLLEDAARKATLPPVPQPIAIADYGCAEGRNSLVPIAAAFAVLRSRDTARSIAVIHTDVPDNDFSALFTTLTADPNSYLRDSAVFASAVGRSFYQQILPSSSVTLGWSSWSVQWLSTVPAAIPDHVQIAYSRDADARAAYERQAADDWRAFLAARELELGPGGCLVVLTMATDDDGEFGYRPLLDAMYAALAAMVTDGSLHSDELRRMAIPTVARSRAAFAAPFGDGGRFGDLSLASLDVFDGDDSIWGRFRRRVTRTRLARNGPHFRAHRCFQRSPPRWMTKQIRYDGRDSSTRWRHLLRRGSRRHLNECAFRSRGCCSSSLRVHSRSNHVRCKDSTTLRDEFTITIGSCPVGSASCSGALYPSDP
jgi:hypothetical protein